MVRAARADDRTCKAPSDVGHVVSRRKHHRPHCSPLVEQSLISLRTRARLAGWMSRRWTAYTAAIVALALNVPFMVVALSRYAQDIRWTSAEGAYTLLLFAGYYVFLIYFLLTLVFLLLAAWPRVFVAASTTILTL